MPAPDQRFSLKEAGPILFWKAFHGCALLGKDGGYIEANDQFCGQLGYSNSELIRHRFHELTHPDDVQRDADQFTHVARGDVSSYEMNKRYIRKDGQPIEVQLRVDAVIDGCGEIICLLAQTKTKESADSLHGITLSGSTLWAVRVMAKLRENWPIILWFLAGLTGVVGSVINYIHDHFAESK